MLLVLGPSLLSTATDPLAQAVSAAGAAWLVPVVRVGAAVAALGSLLALILGVSRTTLAMARDRHLPHFLAAVHPRFGVPHHAELAVGAVVAVLTATVEVRGAIGFSSFGVLTYYAIANVSAWTLTRAEGRPPRAVPAVGLAGCLLLGFALPLVSMITGIAVLALGALAYVVRRRVVRGKYGRRGRSGDPEYGIKNLLVRNLEHLSGVQFAKIISILQADPAGQEIAAAWIGKEKLRHALNLRARVTGSVPCERNIRDRLFAFYDWCAQNDDIPDGQFGCRDAMLLAIADYRSHACHRFGK